MQVTPNSIQDLEFPFVLGPGAHEVRLTATPGEEIIDRTLHNGDLRRVSLQIVGQPVIRDASSGVATRFGDGFHVGETDPTGSWRWLAGDRGTLTVSVAGHVRRLGLSFDATSFAKPRRLVVELDGRVLEDVLVPADSTRQIAIPLVLEPGVHTLRLRASPGPVVADSVLGNGDMRTLSVRVRDPVVEELDSGALASFGPGFSAVESPEPPDERWMAGRTAVVDLDVVGPARAFRLSLHALALAKPRRLAVVVDGRRVATARVVPHRYSTLSIPLELSRGNHRITLTTPSRPTVIDSVLGNGDGRAVTIKVRAPVLEDRRRQTGTPPATIGFGPGFGAAEHDELGTWRWLTGDRGSLVTRVGGDRRGRYTLGFAASSLAEDRALEVAVDGRPVLTTLVPPEVEEFRIPVELAPGAHAVRLRVIPGARRADEVVPDSADPRELSIRVRAPTIAPEPPAAPVVSPGFGYGFGTPLPDDPPGWRWLSGREGNLVLAVTGPRRPVEIRFRAQSFSDRPRTLAVTVGGRTIATRRLSSDEPTTFTVPLRVGAGTYSIGLRATPGGVFHGERAFHPDPRKVSVRIETPVVAER
jgi:hypothetical protein